MNAVAEGNALIRQDFGGTEQTGALVETAATAVAAQAKAMVEARYIMALQRQRNWDQVRQDLLRECRRPAFANNKSAYYRKPIGDGVEGLGIRFVEVALRCMKNILVETTMVYEDGGKEVHRVSVTDLESNLTYPLDVRVSKTVERSKPMDDGSYISMRKNSYGRAVYTVPATDDDLLNKRAALISKAIRTIGLRVIPGDLQDEAEDIIKSVRLDEAAKDPATERKKIVDAFDGINVRAADLTEYLGHDIAACSPQELVNLRGLYSAIKEGEATWAEVMDNKALQGDGGKKAETAKTYPQDQFDANLPKWRQLIQDGKKKPEQIIAMASTKAPLTEDQKRQIHAAVPTIEPDKAAPAVIEGLRTKAKDAAITDAEVAKHLGIASLDDLTVAQVERALAFIKNPAGAQQ